MTSVEELIKEIEASDNPVSYAVFVTGLMAGLICKHSGSNKYGALMMMIAKLDDDLQSEVSQSDIDRLMDRIRERFPLPH